MKKRKIALMLLCLSLLTGCTKMLKDEIGIKNTVRVSMYLYNDKSDIDRLVEVLEKSDDIFKIVI